MPLQLRSGTLKEAPSREFISAYQVYFKEHHAALKRKGFKGADVANQAREDFAKLSNAEQKKYQDIYEEHEEKYQKELVKFYGGSTNDLKQIEHFNQIPDKPRKPLTPVLAYSHENYAKASQENPNQDPSEIRKELAARYARLSNKDKKKYEDAYEQEHKIYTKELKAWEDKYETKFNDLKKFEEEKFQKKPSARREDLDYQELPRYTRPKEPKPLLSVPDSNTYSHKSGKKEQESKKDQDNKRAKSVGRKK